MGLVSDGGVHSHMDHIKALIHMAKKQGIKELCLHAFLDGRDVSPDSGLSYIESLENYMKTQGLGRIATISGRYYAMDRDKRWERVKKTYNTMTLKDIPATFSSSYSAVKASYQAGIYDEFVLPVAIEPRATIKDHDGIIMFNFRSDRAREITRAFVNTSFEGFQRKKTCRDLCYVTMTLYDASIKGVEIAFPPESYKNTLGEYISSLGLRQLRIAETEKYAHVTFFFNGGVEKPNPGEDRILIPSPKVPTYDMQPEMNAPKVTNAVLEQIKKNTYDLIILNFANLDMVGHTGNLKATIEAVEALDSCVSKIVKEVLTQGGQILLTADHGNAESMLNNQGEPITSHSTDPVPLVNISDSPLKLQEGGKLSDVAPTLLSMMNLSIPREMTGKSLLIHKR